MRIAVYSSKRIQQGTVQLEEILKSKVTLK